MNKFFEDKKRKINNKNGWITCPKCSFQSPDYSKYKTCIECGYNFKMTALERIGIICDLDSFNQIDEDKNEQNDKILIGYGKIDDIEVAIGVMDSTYMAGSIGTYLIDKIVYLIDYAKNNKLPLILFSASGGIKVQEGVNALVGMAKLANAISEYKETGIFISYLTNPTYGGLNASLSSLGDIIISEEDTNIGFSGKKVIENELHESLPQDFQTVDYQFNNGFIDIIVKRDESKKTISRILKQYKYNKENIDQTPNKSINKDRCEEGFNQELLINKKELINEIRSEKHIRPYQIVENVFEDLLELHGDRISKDDSSVKCFLAKVNEQYVNVIYVNRRNNIQENIENNFGMINPEGYRKVHRFIKLSEKFLAPIVIFVDTPGANASTEAERNGQASVIANLLENIVKVKVPMISFITGEANSGGAIALITSDYLVMVKCSYLSVISPEAYVDIVYKGNKTIDEITKELKILPSEMIESGIIDEIIDDDEYGNLIKNIKEVINKKIIELKDIKKEELVERRKNKIRNWGNI